MISSGNLRNSNSFLRYFSRIHTVQMPKHCDGIRTKMCHKHSDAAAPFTFSIRALSEELPELVELISKFALQFTRERFLTRRNFFSNFSSSDESGAPRGECGGAVVPLRKLCFRVEGRVPATPLKHAGAPRRGAADP